MTPLQSLPDLHIAAAIKAYGPAVPWILITIGWFISNHQANRRELRKEARSVIEEIAKIVAEVGKDLKTYYKAKYESDEEVEAALSVKIGIKNIATRVERLLEKRPKVLPSKLSAGVQSAVELFFETATGGAFESANKPTSAEIVKILAHQHNAGAALVESLHQAFWKEFK
ncbi:hypothetical protein [Burkholderia gladioli]|uniref:hypothetical protein n=1 Tax=Burkholderia gladioli TaxID=28095 RepID=UPI002FE1FA75